MVVAPAAAALTLGLGDAKSMPLGPRGFILIPVNRIKSLLGLGIIALCTQAHGQEFLKHDAEMMKSLKISARKYADLRVLAKSTLFADLFSRLGEGDCFPGWRPSTRYELAVTIHASIVRDRSILGNDPTQKQLSALSVAIPIQSEFAEELTTELKNLGVDVSALLDDLHQRAISVHVFLEAKPTAQ